MTTLFFQLSLKQQPAAAAQRSLQTSRHPHRSVSAPTLKSASTSRVLWPYSLSLWTVVCSDSSEASVERHTPAKWSTELSDWSMSFVSISVFVWNTHVFLKNELFDLHSLLKDLSLSFQDWNSHIFPDPHLLLRDLRGNSFRCDCKIKWLVDWMEKTNTSVPAIYCASPFEFQGRRIRDLTPRDFNCISAGLTLIFY